LSRDLFKELIIAMTKNLTILNPQVLPISEMAKYAVDLVRRKLSKKYY
jgi:hypothetical protein